MSKGNIQFEYGPDPENPDEDMTHGVFGGSSKDIEKSILADTYVNTRILNRKITAVTTVKGDIGAGTMQELVVQLDNGVELRITGIGLTVKVNS